MQTDSSVEQILEPLFGKVRGLVLSSMKVTEEDRLSVSFPKNLDALLGGDVETVPAPMRLAAHTETPGEPVSEAFEKYRYGKGTVAYRNISNTAFGKSLTPGDATALQRALKAHIKNVSKEMGLIFELQTFAYLIQERKLVPGSNENLAWAQEEILKHHQAIQAKVGGTSTAPRIFAFVTHHAETMAAEIYNKAKSLLKTTPHTVTFNGGTSFTTGSIRQTADLIIDGIGFSMKFTSESSVAIMETTHESMYEMLGGEDPEGFSTALSHSRDKEEMIENVVAELYPLVQRITADKKELGHFVSQLIAGTNPTGTVHRTYTAYRNYVRNSTAVGFSPALMADFDVYGHKLEVPDDASVTVRRTANTVIIHVKKGSKYGTKVQIEAKPEGVVVKMTNLAAQK
jgi:hypothetical protein